MAVDAQILERAKEWLGDNFDEETKRQVKNMIENDEKELVESFYKSLEFGTGGLRGIMGVGTNRMNIYTVGMATQGLANYLNKTYAGQPIKVAIAHDSRNNSQLFAKTVADIFSANGIKAYLFESLRPVPVLSFAVRQLGCNSGVMITASHNPKEYNGYKAYWNDGAQVVPPHDVNIVKEAAAVKVSDIKFKGNPDLIEKLGEDFDQIYLDKVKSLTLSQDDIIKHKDIKIVYTGLRPGEKLYEEKLMAEEGLKKTDNKLIHIGCPIPFETKEFLNHLPALLETAESNSDKIRDAVQALVSTYHPAPPEVTIVKDRKYVSLVKETECAARNN